VSNGVELLSNGLRALERLPKSSALDGAPDLPFYRSRERLEVHEREKERRKEKKKEKKQGRRKPCGYVALLPR
jgi:hypothetical protein